MIPACIEIPAGRSVRGGGPDDKFVNATELPRGEIVIDQPFRMSICPITVEDWQAWKQNGRGDCNPELPVTRVSWFDAVGYCEWLTEKSGKIWRLPTESEWEYACRGGTETPFHTGMMIETAQANFLYSEDGRRVGPGQLLPVGCYDANPFGLHDMHGNVSEWTADNWRSNWSDEAVGDDTRRVVRGGAWDYLPRMLRSSWRDALRPETRRDNLGFRVVTECRCAH
ncbi:MAG: formylglycine-generating enzyme family protein [Verrucomicrobiae bacterium]|nr:formylglycine-generating enzyme family protein [Verrucomicrobiae bacterium]